MRYIEQLKKFFVLLVAGICVSVVNVNSASALSNTEYYLSVIAQNTYSILDRVNNLPTLLENISTSLLSVMKQDDEDGSIILATQGDFASLGQLFSGQSSGLNTIQKQVVADMLNVSINDFSEPRDNPAILSRLPEINELSYSTLLDMPPASKGAANKYNYIKNAAGFNLQHPIPSDKWKGKEFKKKQYEAYFKTLTAVESYNAYILSRLAFDSGTTAIQDQLVSQASSSSWMAEIATEEIGKVLRQILLFQSQNYVLNTQIQKSIRDIVTVQAMNNSLMVLFNYRFEDQLVRSAQGLPARA